MNEDELQEYIGRRIDILDPDAVIPALETVHKNSGIPLVLVHSAAWALAYGHNAGMMRASQEGGVTMAASRFRSGDDINPPDLCSDCRHGAQGGCRFRQR